jgi:hypothetical protein
MNNYTLTLNFELPAANYVTNNLAHSENFIKKHILSRISNFGLLFFSGFAALGDTIIGSFAGLGSIATLGMHDGTFLTAMEHLEIGTRSVLAYPYGHLLRTINPNALPESKRDDNPPYVDKGGKDGLLAHYALDKLKNIARSCYNSENFFKKHVASRLTYVLMAIASVVTRIADFFIGLVAALLSLLTFGKFETINNIAFRALQAPAMLKDLFYCTIKFINPWAGLNANKEK